MIEVFWEGLQLGILAYAIWQVKTWRAWWMVEREGLSTYLMDSMSSLNYRASLRDTQIKKIHNRLERIEFELATAGIMLPVDEHVKHEGEMKDIPVECTGDETTVEMPDGQD